MADSANVQSIEAIREIRDALVRFMEDARNALNDTEFDLRRTVDWVTHDRRLFWVAEVRRRNQEIADARSALQRKELGRRPGSNPDTTVEEKALRLAKARFAEAEEKVETVRSWGPELLHSAQEYRSRANPLSDMITGDLQNAIAKLARMIESLENYLHVPMPSVSATAPTSPSSAPLSFTRPAPASKPAEEAASVEEPVAAVVPEAKPEVPDEFQRRFE